MGKLKVVVIGGGSSYTPELMDGFLKRYDEFPITEIVLVDVELGLEKLNIIYDLTKRMIKKYGYNVQLEKTLNRKEALVDADFVVTQFRVGGLQSRILDETIPLKYGVIGQETNGPGGLFKALRTVPVVLEIVKDIEEVCPNAWFVNFTNPTGIISEAVFNYTQFKKYIGLCNVPIHMKMDFAKILDCDVNDLHVEFIGLNHMVFATKITLNNLDRTDEVIRRLREQQSNMKNIDDMAIDLDFIRSLGMIPCPYHKYYYKEDEMLAKQLKAEQTRAEQVLEIETNLFKLYQDPTLDHKPKLLEERGGAYYSDAACDLITSIYNNKNNEHYVNILNNGSINNLGSNDVIETTAIVGLDGAKPSLDLDRIPTEIHGLISSIKAFEKYAAKAAVTKKYSDMLVAMNINPLVHSDYKAHQILDEMLEANKLYVEVIKNLD